jgi:regulatory protein
VALLARREHSARELAAKLRRKGCDPDAVEQAVARLLEEGYLDDERYARAVVRRRAGARGRSAIRGELVARGVSRDVVAATVDELDGEEEIAAAVALLRQWHRVPEGFDDLLEVAGPRLYRRGFSQSVARTACRRFAAEAIAG